jgi:hypothetical protein
MRRRVGRSLLLLFLLFLLLLERVSRAAMQGRPALPSRRVVSVISSPHDHRFGGARPDPGSVRPLTFAGAGAS